MTPDNVKTIYETYPLTVREVEGYVADAMKIGSSDVEELEKLNEQIQKNLTEAVKTFMVMGERFLYEFFDERNMFMSVGPSLKGWLWIINFGDVIESAVEELSCRREAEEAGFMAAFKIREEWNEEDIKVQRNL